MCVSYLGFNILGRYIVVYGDFVDSLMLVIFVAFG